MKTSIEITIEQIVNTSRPDLPFRYKVQWPGHSTGSCVSTFQEAKDEVSGFIISDIQYLMLGDNNDNL